MQHICWQAAGGELPTTQRWKQAMLLAHWKSLRQAVVSSQQAPTTHWLQGVPPGSSGQAPASGGALPQWPPTHTSPTQHWAGVLQVEPGGRHAPAPQIPLSQTSVQHSAADAHGNPSSLH